MEPLTGDSLLRGCSEQLRAFVDEAPLVRRSIFTFVAGHAHRLAPGSRVLDVGAGDAPYRELFAAHEYATLDHAETLHAGEIDMVGSADAIPVSDDSFDAVLCTEVLEHVPNPMATLTEFARVLAPGGVVIATVPFAWEEHEAPHDYYRYTRYGLGHMLEQSGFADIDVQPRSDSFTTLAQLMRNVGWVHGSAPDGLDALRVEARETLTQLSDALLALAPLDVECLLPLGFSVYARLPRSSA